MPLLTIINVVVYFAVLVLVEESASGGGGVIGISGGPVLVGDLEPV